MHLSPPRHHKRRSDEANLAPVKGDEPHAEARYSPKELVDDEVVCRDRFVSCHTKIREKRYALGAIQHTHEKNDKPTNKKAGKNVHRNMPVIAYKRTR